MSENVWIDAANTIVNAGQIPIPVTETLQELIKTLINEKQAEFIRIFDKPLNMDQIIEKTGQDRKSLDKILNELMDVGVVTGIPSKSTGVVVYRLLPAVPGIFEFSLMRGETGEKEKKLAKLFDKLFSEMSDLVQENYDSVVPALKSLPAIDRIIPVESEIDVKKDEVMPAEEVRRIIDQFDTISVATCYCRHEKDLLNDPCKVTDKKENCLLFGPGAQFTIDHNFARPISKEDARRILNESEDAGLVHKSFHVKLDPEREQEAICSCCKCCCGTFQLYYRGVSAMHSVTSYIAEMTEEECTGCGVCVDMCPMEAINIIDDIANIDKDRCLGCGICAHHCDYDAARLVRTGKREVFVLPPRLVKE